MTVQNFVKIVWTDFEKFEIFMKRSGEKKHDCISSRKFFPTPKKADPHLTRMILLNMFQIFQITRINFDQYLHIHKHPDTYSTRKDATTQTEHTTIKPKRLIRTLSNRMRSEMEKQRLNSYWPSDDNDDTDEDLQKDPPEALIDDNYPHKTYTYVSF